MIEDLAARLDLQVSPQLITIGSIDEAIRYRHIGGPTIQINDLDIEPEARAITRFGLA